MLDFVYCVKWNPAGVMLASASGDETVKLLDFKAGKVILTGHSSDKSEKELSLNCLYFSRSLESANSVCFI